MTEKLGQGKLDLVRVTGGFKLGGFYCILIAFKTFLGFGFPVNLQFLKHM